MRKITISISDEDYEDMVRHFACEQVGQILVAVSKVHDDTFNEDVLTIQDEEAMA